MILTNRAMSPSRGAFHSPHAQPDEEPVSRTYQYRKVMKPMLERKRRARINRCLDELKDLMVTALQAEGENVSKLEKADILELTVRHLHSLKERGQLVLKPEMSYAERFRAGFTQCATEVSQFIANATLAANAMQRQGPVDPQAGARLLQHLSNCIGRLESTQMTKPQSTQPYGVARPTPIQPQPQHAQSHPPVPQQAVPLQRISPAMLPEQGCKRPWEPPMDAQAALAKRQYVPPSPPDSPAFKSEPTQSMVWRPW
ncbi:enhancer of split mbeta protein-like [Amyelois transitella]|uniref:enhancer of split mbeta protein-like n=1 Tax=Amyelois transitella TaxID=680683 RepID=UPI00067E0C34|nr:enhancer of split mbeta protein-like [Amyelois transitella]